MPFSLDAAAFNPLPRRRFALRVPRFAHWAFGDVVGTSLLIVVVMIALIGPVLTPYQATVPSGGAFLSPGSPQHLLGTDDLGYDVLTRVLVGLRTSLFAALAVTIGSAVFGMILGTLSGFLGGWVDSVLMRVTDLFLALPATIVAMAIAAGLGPSLSSSMIGIALVWWPLYARVVRGEVRRVATSLHVQAARMSGTRGIPLVVRHIMPTVLPTVVVTSSLDIGGVIMTLASLAFIGLGTPAPAPELGLMASSGLQFVLNAWWVAIMPAAAVGILALLFNYFGDAMRKTLRGQGA